MAAKLTGFPWLRALPVVLFGALTIAFAIALYGGDPSKLPSTLVGKPVPPTSFPPIEGLLRDGRPMPGFASADLARGHPSVVNFWASWCAPCIEEYPLLGRLKSMTGVDLYGVNYKDTPEAARRFIGRFGNPFTAIGTDAKGRNAIDWGVYGMPETFIVDGRGVAVYKHIGALTEEAIVNKFIPAIEKAKQKVPAASP